MSPVPDSLAPARAQSSWVLLRRLFFNHLRPHLGGFAVAGVFMAVGAGTTGALAKMIEPIVNQLGQDHSSAYVLLMGGGLLALFGVRGLATYVHTVMMNRMGQRIVTDIQQGMHRHLLEADLAFFHAHSSGVLLARLTSDVAVMRQAVGECWTSSLKGGLTLIFLVGVMFYQDWKLSLAAFFVFPLSAFFVAIIGRHMRRYATKTQEAIARLTALLTQTFQGMRPIKAYGLEEREHTVMREVTESVYQLALKSYRASALSNPMAEVLSGVAMATVILYGHWQIREGLSTTGALFSFITAFVLAYDPMKRTAKVNAQLQAGLAAAERVFQVLDMRPAIVNAPAAEPLRSRDSTVRFENVSFGYAPNAPLALDHVTLTMAQGTTVAVVGPSGAGKSSLINLIPRFYDVTEGTLTIGGQNVRTITLDSLRRNLALVSQEPALFDDTIRANILFGRPEATEAEVRDAARDASADAFIQALPNGYDTRVGEQGVKLSGGQRQRIAIARAILRNAPLLLLDEATSALDAQSEQAVQDALKRLQKGRTTLVVAHRLSTVVDADTILVLDHGRLVQQGSHAQLVAQEGLYARLYARQGGPSEEPEGSGAAKAGLPRESFTFSRPLGVSAFAGTTGEGPKSLLS